MRGQTQKKVTTNPENPTSYDSHRAMAKKRKSQAKGRKASRVKEEVVEVVEEEEVNGSVASQHEVKVGLCCMEIDFISWIDSCDLLDWYSLFA